MRALKRALRTYLPRLPILTASAGAGIGGAAAGQAVSGGIGGPGEAAACGICSVPEILAPYEAVPCGHRFCYYCLRSQCLGDAQYCCPLCLVRVEAMQRVVLRVPDGGGGRGDAAAGGVT